MKPPVFYLLGCKSVNILCEALNIVIPIVETSGYYHISMYLFIG